MKTRRGIAFVALAIALTGAAVLPATPAMADGGELPFECGKTVEPPIGTAITVTIRMSCKTLAGSVTAWTISGTLKNGRSVTGVKARIDAVIGYQNYSAVAKGGQTRTFSFSNSGTGTPRVALCTPPAATSDDDPGLCFRL